MPDDQLFITSGRATASIDTVAGGRVAQITVAGQPLLIDADPSRSATITWGSFPMAPWAGRIRHGRFTFDGVDHQLECNHVDVVRGIQHRHAIHGSVHARRWNVEHLTATTVTMSCPLDGGGGGDGCDGGVGGDLNWPFEGTARQRIEVSDGHLDCRLSVESGGSQFPAVIGWHPWFPAPAGLRFAPDSMYRRDEFGLPTGALVAPTPGPWDDCFIARGPAILVYDREEAPLVTIASDCDHRVVFDEPADTICIEPQSGPPDGLNIGHEIVTPDRPLTRSMRISW